MKFILLFIFFIAGSFFPLILFLLFIVILVCQIELSDDIETNSRRDYYRNDYLKSDAWQRKRFVVLKRDGWRCVYCGDQATQVHHKKYARNIGNEPIDWLVSVCKPCHDSIHGKLDIDPGVSAAFIDLKVHVSPVHYAGFDL